MTPDPGLGSLDDVLDGIALSSTSTSKFDAVRDRIASWAGIDPASIYAVTVGKDFKVRFEQSKDARSLPYGLAVLKDPSWLDVSLPPARSMVEAGLKQGVVLVGRRDGGLWEILSVVEDDSSALSERLAQHVPVLTVERIHSKSATEEEVFAEWPGALLTPETFDLLADLAQDPTASFYSSHREDFRRVVEQPIQTLLAATIAHLPPSITEYMETSERLYARIPKNDYGRGGAWPFYWGAIFAGESRIRGVQLFVWVNGQVLRMGFYIAEYGDAYRQRFYSNVRQFGERIAELLGDLLGDERFEFGSTDRLLADSWRDWLARPADTGATVALNIDRVIAEHTSAAELVDLTRYTFEALFPLVLLATEEDPIPAIAEYLADRNLGAAINPVYETTKMALDLGLEQGVVDQWSRAVDRHGQAILYGPPGTGKTFVALRLADHLIGGSDGFKDLVQFHPAYSYEDFIQGLRPRAREGGGLDYPIVPGRFLEFCREARRRKGRCVLIIDEINRANLSRVLGELMYLLEYRDGSPTGDAEVRIPLASGERFGIPTNVRIIGTMNTADRSIALVDHALRRRFAFLPLYPNYHLLDKYLRAQDFPADELVRLLKQVNAAIGDRNYEVGVTYFLRPALQDDLGDIWQLQIEPYLEEYFFDRPGALDNLRWIKVRDRFGV
jgi:5-methylcytosine-specific restriction enzyme B